MSMGEWLSKTLGQVATLNYGKSLPAKGRITGVVPVYGSNGIVGWHNKGIVNKAGIIVGRKGSVGAVHLSDQPFCPIDTTYFITADDTKADISFLYYLLLHLNLSRFVSDLVPGLNRDLAYAQDILIPDTEIEQHRIAAVLSLVQRAIEQQERLIALNTELKKAMMHKLFTEGTRSESQKQTEIGPIPESWEVVKLVEIVKFKTGKLNSNAAVENGKYPFFTCSQQDYRIDTYAFDEEAILLSGNNAKAIYSVKYYKGKFNAYQRTYVITISDINHYDYQFLKFALSMNLEKLRTISIGTSTKYLTLGLLQNLLMYCPSIEEQKAIGKSLNIIETAIDIVLTKKLGLQNLFRTLLRQLMTAEIRVGDLDLSELGLRTQETEFNGGKHDEQACALP